MRLIAEDAYLHDLGLKANAVADQAGHYRQALPELWGNLPALVEALFREQGEAVLRIASENASDYDGLLEQLGHGNLSTLRPALAVSLLRDLDDYATGTAPWDAKARERLYWLAVALADRDPTNGEIDAAAIAQAAGERQQALYSAVYRGMAEVSFRTPIDENEDAGFERIQRTINALLEGYVVHRRLGHVISRPEIVDAVIRLFFILTRPIDGVEIDIDKELQAGADRRLGRDEAPDQRRVTVGASVEEAYEVAISTLENARRYRSPSVIRHASFHGSSQSSVQTDSYEAARLKSTMAEMLAARWHLHRLVAIRDTTHLDEQVRIAETLWLRGAKDKNASAGSPAAVEVRGAVLDGSPRLAPLVVGEDAALLGLDDRFHNVIQRAIALEGREMATICVAHFDELWNDRRRTRPILGPDGLDEDGIAQLRRDLV